MLKNEEFLEDSAALTAEIISSERHEHLAPPDEWRPVTRGEMVTWRFH